jgi:hypothetical protein
MTSEIPDGFSDTLVIGGRLGLWEEFLLKWLQLMREAKPEISARAESGLEPGTHARPHRRADCRA